MNELINYLCVVCYIVSLCVNSLPNAPCPTSPIAKCIVIFSDKRMPGCAYLTKYLDFRNENKVRVGDWAEQTEQKGVAKCTVCGPGTTISFKSKGAKDLTNHSMRRCHIEAAAAAAKEKGKQAKLTNFLQSAENEKFKKDVQDLEIALVVHDAEHDVPHTHANCLTRLLKKYVHDSEIVKAMTLNNDKAQYISTHGVGDYFMKQTVSEMKNCDAFSISIDESEVNKKSELEIMVRFSNEKGIQNKHYKSIDLEAGDAKTITDSVLETLEEDGINYQSKLINCSMDGCATMQGSSSGVITRMKENVDQLEALGSCNSHNCSNAMKHAVQKFDPDIEDVLLNTYIVFGGQKGRGLKKQKMFKTFCSDKGFSPLPFKRFVSTRFCIMRDCIKPILNNIDLLRSFLKTIDKPTTKEKNLQKFYVQNYSNSNSCSSTMLLLKLRRQLNSSKKKRDILLTLEISWKLFLLDSTAKCSTIRFTMNWTQMRS